MEDVAKNSENGVNYVCENGALKGGASERGRHVVEGGGGTVVHTHTHTTTPLRDLGKKQRAKNK